MSRATAWLPWLALATLMAHVAEELPTFPAWATHRFGTTTVAWYLISHVPVLIIAGVIVVAAARPAPTRRAIDWLWVMITAMGTNGLFHVGAALWFGEYSPGLVTALIGYPPLVLFAGRTLPRPRPAVVLGGVCLALLLTASLWLDVPVGRS